MMTDRLPFKLAGTDDFVNGVIDIVHAIVHHELSNDYNKFTLNHILLTIVRDLSAFIRDENISKILECLKIDIFDKLAPIYTDLNVVYNAFFFFSINCETQIIKQNLTEKIFSILLAILHPV